MSADDSMDLDYGIPPSQPAFFQLSFPVPDKRPKIGWQNSQSSSQNALSALMADVEGESLDTVPASAPAPLVPIPEFPVASTSASASGSVAHRADRRRRRAQQSEPEPVQSFSAVQSLFSRLKQKIPDPALARPPSSKENGYEREKRRISSSSAKPRSREASSSSAASSGPQTPDLDTSRAWPAPQLEGATSNGGARTRSLGSGQLASSAAASASIRHHSLPDMARRLPTDSDVSMGDGCSVTDAFSRAALDSPSSAVAAWPSPVTEKSSPAPDRFPDSPDTSHLPPDTSILPDTSRLLPPNLQRRSSSPAARASGTTRPLSRTSSSSTAVPAHQSRDSTPQAVTSAAAPSGKRSLKRTGSGRTLSRDDIFKAIATAPPSPEVTRRPPTSRQTAPPGSRPTSHAPAPSQRPKMLGMRREFKPYGTPSAKRFAPTTAAPAASQGYRIQGFKPPLAKKPVPIIPKPERASTPPRPPPPRKQVQAPTPDSSQPQRHRNVDVKAEVDEKMPDIGDSSFNDLSFGIDADTLDQAMEQYD